MSPLTSDQSTTLITRALGAREGSYSPYSSFRVGAALLADDGMVVGGANVECASYGGTICAERTAIVKAVSEGKRRFIGLAVSSDVAGAISPCGLCRQVLREFCPLDMPIYLVPGTWTSSTEFVTLKEGEGRDDVGILTSMGELLPMSFGPEDLGRPKGVGAV